MLVGDFLIIVQGSRGIATLGCVLKCAQGVKRASCIISHKRIEPKLFFSDIKYVQAKHCQKTVKTSQPPLNILPEFNILNKQLWINPFM